MLLEEEGSLCVGAVLYLGECGLYHRGRDIPMLSVDFGRRGACPMVIAVIELTWVAV